MHIERDKQNFTLQRQKRGFFNPTPSAVKVLKILPYSPIFDEKPKLSILFSINTDAYRA